MKDQTKTWANNLKFHANLPPGFSIIFFFLFYGEGRESFRMDRFISLLEIFYNDSCVWENRHVSEREYWWGCVFTNFSAVRYVIFKSDVLFAIQFTSLTRYTFFCFVSWTAYFTYSWSGSIAAILVPMLERKMLTFHESSKIVWTDNTFYFTCGRKKKWTSNSFSSQIGHVVVWRVKKVQCIPHIKLKLFFKADFRRFWCKPENVRCHVNGKK